MKSIRIGKYAVPLWLIAVILVSGISGTLGYYIWKTLTVSIEIKEPIEILQYPSSLSLYPGETKEFNVTLDNHASLNYSVVLDFHLDNESYQTDYVSFSDTTYKILPGQQTIQASLTVKESAPAINALLSIDFVRIEDFLFYDDFDSATLKSGWNFIDVDGGSSFSLSAHQGWIRVTTTSPPWRDLYGPVGLNAPRLVLLGTSGDFTIETKVMGNMDEEWESGGILVWRDSNNFIRLDRACGAGNSQRVIFDATMDGSWLPTDAVLSSNINPTYLRLARSGDVFYGYYSADGTNWYKVGELTFPIDYPVDMGILLANVYHDGTLHADFDYFRVHQ